MELSYWGISPNIPAWPTDENGEREQAVLLAHTFDSPADADVTISLLTAYGSHVSNTTTRSAAPERSSTASPASAWDCTSRPPWRRTPRICWPPCPCPTRQASKPKGASIMSYMQEYEKWLASHALSEQEHAELESIRDDEKEIRERFYGPLEFGTAGLRHHEGGPAPDEHPRHPLGHSGLCQRHLR